jgi:hypothetical protein
LKDGEFSNGFININFITKEKALVEDFREGKTLIALDGEKALFLPSGKAVDVAVMIDKTVEEGYLKYFYRFWKEGKIAIGWDKDRKDFVTIPSVLELIESER